MALIKCPECGKEVSDKAAVCIHCGYPLQAQASVSMIGSQLQKVVIPSMRQPSDNKIAVITLVRRLTGLGLAQAKELIESSNPVIKDGLTPDEANEIIAEFSNLGVKATALDSSARVESVIRCPKCGSTEYHAGARGFSIVTGFVGSGKTVLTCLKCGHRWKPGK
jgi:ribosomal protein L7/L12